jgi:peptide/nickel transport system permease protein
MVADGQKFFGFKDYLWLYPSLALAFTTLGFVFLADGLRDALDPKLRGRR